MRSITEYEVSLKRPHEYQAAFLNSKAKRKIIRAGRRSGKTTGVAIAAVRYFLGGMRVLYIAPTEEQISHFWREVKSSLARLIADKVFWKSETDHTNVDKNGIAISIEQHRPTDIVPGGLIHQLPLVDDEQVGMVAAQGIGIPGGLCLDALVRAGALAAEFLKARMREQAGLK